MMYSAVWMALKHAKYFECERKKNRMTATRTTDFCRSSNRLDARNMKDASMAEPTLHHLLVVRRLLILQKCRVRFLFILLPCFLLSRLTCYLTVSWCLSHIISSVSFLCMNSMFPVILKIVRERPTSVLLCSIFPSLYILVLETHTHTI